MIISALLPMEITAPTIEYGSAGAGSGGLRRSMPWRTGRGGRAS